MLNTTGSHRTVLGRVNSMTRCTFKLLAFLGRACRPLTGCIIRNSERDVVSGVVVLSNGVSRRIGGFVCRHRRLGSDGIGATLGVLVGGLVRLTMFCSSALRRVYRVGVSGLGVHCPSSFGIRSDGGHISAIG